MAQVYPGYMGLADIGGTLVRFADANIVATQSVEAPDLIMGDYDRDAYVYGKIEVGGSISGPVTETFSSAVGGSVWDWATDRDDCGNPTEKDMNLYYFCGGTENTSRSFTGMLVNSVNFSCSAGDIAQFSIDVMGRSAGPWGSGDPPPFTTVEKLVTWDKVSVSISGSTEFAPAVDVGYSNFDFTVSNNLEAVYSLGQANLFPYDIVPGLRQISGSISVYNVPSSNGFDRWDDYDATPIGTIQFNIGTLVVNAKVRFHRVEPANSVGPIMSTVAFTGVGPQFR